MEFANGLSSSREYNTYVLPSKEYAEVPWTTLSMALPHQQGLLTDLRSWTYSLNSIKYLHSYKRYSKNMQSHATVFSFRKANARELPTAASKGTLHVVKTDTKQERTSSSTSSIPLPSRKRKRKHRVAST